MNDALDDLMARVRKTNEKLKELGVSVDGAVPDYNEDGTANPIGDASYWRSRAEAAEKDLRTACKMLLNRILPDDTELDRYLNHVDRAYGIDLIKLPNGKIVDRKGGE